ncbi:MAG TPA: ATP-grasp domain-containing protein [Methanotrichaceae archaeon]|nr:ATP-grasp domain-containing protein [Methanotrichaceae archaeon]
MKILIAEYAVATGMPGTYLVEGRAMLSTLARSFERLGHQVIYPTVGPTIGAGEGIHIRGEEDFEDLLEYLEATAGLVIAPDELLPGFLELLEDGNTINLGCSPAAARLCADKLACTHRFEEEGVPVAEIADSNDDGPFVLKPRFGCGSERMELVETLPENLGDRIATKYHPGEALSVSLIASGDRVLPLTVNKQLVSVESGFEYVGGIVPHHSDREEEILQVAKMAALALDLRGYAGIDLVVGDLPRVVDVNPRPTTSIVGISKVMREELADLILRARFSSLPERVTVEGVCEFRKDQLEIFSG